MEQVKLQTKAHGSFNFKQPIYYYHGPTVQVLFPACKIHTQLYWTSGFGLDCDGLQAMDSITCILLYHLTGP